MKLVNCCLRIIGIMLNISCKGVIECATAEANPAYSDTPAKCMPWSVDRDYYDPFGVRKLGCLLECYKNVRSAPHLNTFIAQCI